MSYKIDATDPKNLSNKILSEEQTRRKLLNHAKLIGCEKEMLILFAQADKQMRNCSNQKERQDIGKLYAILTYKLLGGGGQLFVDNQLVCDDRSKEEKENNNNTTTN